MSIVQSDLNRAVQVSTPKIRVNLSVTRMCNLSCDYCYVPKDRIRLSYEVGKRLIDWIADNFSVKNMDLILLGGEPLLEKEILSKLIPWWRKRARERNIRLLINTFTNGTLIDHENAEWLRKNFDTVSVSIDGSKEMHDMHRKYSTGEGSYKRAIEGLKTLLMVHPRVGTITVVTRESVPHLVEGIDHLVNEIGVRSIFYQPLFPPTEKWTERDLRIFENQLLELGEMWMESQTTCNAFRLLSWHGIFKSILTNTPYTRRCSTLYMFVSEDGRVYHCHDYEILFSNSSSSPETSILENPSREWFEYWHKTGSADCNECQVLDGLKERESDFYPEVLDRIYEIEERVCREFLKRLKDEPWFEDYLRLDV